MTMTRREFHPPHVYGDNTCYFLSAGTVHHQPLLATHAQRAIVRDVLKDAVRQYGVRLYAWVILANHYRLLLHTGHAAPLWKFVKRLHGESAVRLNKLDGTPARRVWFEYWDRCLRNERDFWAFFNYIHLNPIKHGYVAVAAEAFVVDGKQSRIASGYIPDVHDCLARYPYSSYHYYLRKYGEEFLTDAWLRYPVHDYLEGDDFRSG